MPDEHSLTGKMLGRFHVLEKVGEGGMGVVYRATDTRLNRTVALKLIHPTLLEDADARRRFLREAQAASALTHPNVCIIHSIEEEGGQLFLVLEYLEGSTMKARAAELRTDWKKLLDCLIQGGEGLAEAHRCHVVHRDIKPANLWITLRDQVKIMDFGLAKQIGPAKAASESAATADFTERGVTVGTTHYMSPEQARGREVDTRSDIFSFGAVLFEMATGKLPFSGAGTVDVLDQILNAEPPPPSQIRPDLPAAFDRLVTKCLRKPPDERYQSAADAVVDLKAIRRELDSGPRTPMPGTVPASSASVPVAPVTPASGSSPAHSPLKSAILILATLAVVVGLTIAGVLALSQKKTASGTAARSGRPNVAVLSFENKTGDAKLSWYGTNAAELLAVDLAKLPNVDVISKQRIYDVLKELKMNENMPALDANVATEVARKSGATIMVRGDTLLLAGTVILKAEAVEVSSGRVLAAERVTEVSDKNMLKKVDELGGLLREKLKAVP